MIAKLTINGVHANVDDDLHKYVVKKVGHLDRYLSKHARVSAHADVKLKESKAKDKKQCTCEVILHLPKEVITIQESTINMFAAIDIVEAKLRNRIKKYKGLHESPRLHRKLLNRLRRHST
jgi:ribosomal subunit interface protein